MKICNNLKFQLLQQTKISYLGQIMYKYRENYNTPLKLVIFTA